MSDCDCDHRPEPRVAIVPLVKEYRLASSGSPSYVDLTLPDIELWGPYLEAITIHQKTVNRSGTHAWNVALQYGLDGKSWWGGSPIALDGYTSLFGADIDSNITTVSADFNNTSYFGLRLQLALRVTGGLGDAAIVTAFAAFRFRSSWRG